jgi:ABC-type dipeptide/oligopeptide/nickel transport system permease component
MNQIFHPYWKWECFKNGMWRKESKEYEEIELPKIIAFTGCHNSYGSAMIDVINEDFIRTAEAKGLSSFRIYFIHALRNAMIPILTSFGILLGMLLVGAVLTETIFSWPGVGKWIVQSIAARDYPVLQSGLLMLASVVVITNFCVDLLYLILDPRTRQKIQGGRS